MNKILTTTKAAFAFVLMMLVLPSVTHAQKYEGKYFNNLNYAGVIIDG